MKPLSLIIGFLPLVVFSVLTRQLPSGDIGIAGIASAAIAAIGLLTIRPVWPPKILNTCQFVLFGVIGIVGFTVSTGTDSWLATWAGSGVAVVIGLVILVLLPVMPFTEQFARESVPRELWSSPMFKQINRVLSATWGVAILVLGFSRLGAAALNQYTSSHVLPQIVFGAVIPVLILVYMFRFSKAYPDQVLRHRALPSAAAA
jgi:hypothetical protein